MDKIPSIHIEAAEKFVYENDRAKYVEFQKACEKFISNRKLVIGGNIGTSILLNQQYTDTTYYIYSMHPYKDAKDLADYLFESNKDSPIGKYISLKTNIKNKMLTIFVNTRKFAVINYIGYAKNVKLLDLIKPIAKRSPLSHDVLVMSPDYQMISLYQDIYNPDNISKLKQMLEYESDLYKFAKKELEIKIGGGKSLDEFNKVHNRVYSALSDEIFIGDYAQRFLANDDVKNSDRIQVITSNFKSLINKLQKISPDISYNKVNLYIDDSRLFKYIIYYNMGDKRRSLLDVFNSCEYETIPVIQSDKHLVASHFVLLRFRFIDIWTLRMISHFNIDTSSKIAAVMESIDSLKQECEKLLSENPRKLFPMTTEKTHDAYYTGIFNDLRIHMRNLGMKDRRIPLYYPVNSTTRN